MPTINAYGPFVGKALREIENRSDFMLRIPRWKESLIRSLVDEALLAGASGGVNPIGSLRGAAGALRSFCFSPIGTLIRMAQAANYSVSRGPQGILAFRANL